MDAIEFHEILQPSDHREFTLAAQIVLAPIRPKAMRRADFKRPYLKVVVPGIVLMVVFVAGLLYGDLSSSMRALLIVVVCVSLLLGLLYIFMMETSVRKREKRHEAAMQKNPAGNQIRIDEQAITTRAVDGSSTFSMTWDNVKISAVSPNLYIFIEASSDIAVFFNKVNLTPEQLETLEALIAAQMTGTVIRTK